VGKRPRLPRLEADGPARAAAEAAPAESASATEAAAESSAAAHHVAEDEAGDEGAGVAAAAVVHLLLVAVDVAAGGVDGCLAQACGFARFADAGAGAVLPSGAGVLGDCLGGVQVAFGFGEAGSGGGADHAAAGADDVAGAGDLGAGVHEGVVQGLHGAVECVGGVAGVLEVFVEVGVGVGEFGPGAEGVGGAGAFGGAEGVAAGVDGGGERGAVDVGGAGCGEEVGGLVDFAAHFGDEGFEAGDG